jgi:hypothetical protein
MFALPPIDPGVEMTVSSRGMSKGIEQADEPQVIPKVYAQVGSLQLGAQWKNVTSATADGEGAAFVNWGRKFGAIQLALGAAYKFQTGATPGTDSDSLELTGGLTHKAGKLSLKLNAIYSPDDLGRTKHSLFVEGGPSFDVTKTLRLSANVGRRTRRGAQDYIAANFGATKTLFRGFSLDLRYYQTNRANLGDIYRRRLVLAGRWAF